VIPKLGCNVNIWIYWRQGLVVVILIAYTGEDILHVITHLVRCLSISPCSWYIKFMGTYHVLCHNNLSVYNLG